MVDVQIFLHDLLGKRVILDQEDVLLMKNVKDGRFSVKHFYLRLTMGQESLFPFRVVWNYWMPTKVGFFAREASWGKVLTLDQLKKKGRPLIDPLLKV